MRTSGDQIRSSSFLFGALICLAFAGCGSNPPGDKLAVIPPTIQAPNGGTPGGSSETGAPGSSAGPIETPETSAPAQAKIGVLLPLEGRKARTGAYLQRLVGLAATASGAGIELLVRDIGAGDVNLDQVITQLVEQDRAVALIAPSLQGSDIRKVQERAEALEVPLLLVENRYSIPVPEEFSYTFRHGLTYADQIDALLRAVQPRASAVFYPAPAGVSVKNSFVTSARADGVHVSRSVAYPNSSVNAVMNSARKLVHRTEIEIPDYESRLQACEDVPAASFERECRRNISRDAAGYEQKLRSCIESASEGSRTRCKRNLERSRVRLRYAFDSIFLPSAPATFASLFGALHYAGIDLRKVRLLGLDSWDSPDLIDAIRTAVFVPEGLDPLKSPMVENIVFASGFHPSGHDDLRAIAFVSGFMQEFGVKPNTADAHSYDMVLILAHALASDPGIRTGAELAEALRTAGPYDLATGIAHFDEAQRTRRKIALLGFRNGEITVIDRQ